MGAYITRFFPVDTVSLIVPYCFCSPPGAEPLSRVVISPRAHPRWIMEQPIILQYGTQLLVVQRSEVCARIACTAYVVNRKNLVFLKHVISSGVYFIESLQL